MFGLFLPSIRFDFLDYDDDVYVTANEHVQKGLTLENVRWAFGDVNVGFYHPLTLLSHMLDSQLYGLKPWGHHLTSVLLHAANALLIFLFLTKMTGSLWRSLFVAALFGIHPLRVESVAWIGERKDVLSTFFGLLSLLFYASYAKANRRSPIAYGLTLLFFAMGLLSKPMLVTWPFIFLLLDFWPFERVSRLRFEVSGSATSNRKPQTSNFYGLILEKIPFFLLAITASAITVIAEKKWGALHVIELPFLARLDNALISYCRYLGKTFVPINLAVLYPHPGSWPVSQVISAAILIVGLSFLSIVCLRRRPYFAVGWFWFLGTLIPVIGLVQVVFHAMADRYVYVPSIGLLIFLTWSVCDWSSRWQRQRTTLGIFAAIILLGCAALTSHQLGFWKNNETLFRHALAVTKNNAAMHYALGATLAKAPERLDEAVSEFREALRIKSDDVETHVQLAETLEKIPDQSGEAIAHYETALRLNPDDLSAHAAHYNLGIAMAQTGRLPEAISHFQAALRVKPDDADAHVNLGIAFFKNAGRLPEAIQQFEEALRLNPESVMAHYNLGSALKKTPGREQEAISHYEQALRIAPDFIPAQQALERLRTERHF